MADDMSRDRLNLLTGFVLPCRYRIERNQSKGNCLRRIFTSENVRFHYLAVLEIWRFTSLRVVSGQYLV